MTLDTARLAPAARAELIYRLARSDLDQQLWQAALGRPDARDERLPGSAAPAAPPTPRFDLGALVDALAAEDRFAPALRPEPVPPPPSPASTGRLALGANAGFAPAIEAAAARSGLAPALLAAIVDAEAAKRPDGRWDADSRNPRSSATGLGQFLSGTWLGEAQRPGSFLNTLAAERGWLTEGGRVAGEARAPLLALRSDPAVALHAVADHAAANLRRLRAAGVAPTDLPGKARAAYLAHHLGLGDALRYLGGGLGEERAGRLLAAQVGAAAASRRIETAGAATLAHRAWLDAYVERRINPVRYLSV